MEVTGTIKALTDIYTTLKGVLIILAAVKCMLILNKRQDDDQPLELALNKCGTVIKATAIGILITDFIQIFKRYWGRANGIGTNFIQYYVSGLEVFVGEVRGTIILLDITLTAFFVAKNLMLAMKADETEKIIYRKKAGKNITVGIVILCTYGLVTLIFNYFI